VLGIFAFTNRPGELVGNTSNIGRKAGTTVAPIDETLVQMAGRWWIVPDWFMLADRLADNLLQESLLMPCQLICPNLRCRKILSVPEEMRGKVVKCQHCLTSFRVPPTKLVSAPIVPERKSA
jgi:hypothetical protein